MFFDLAWISGTCLLYAVARMVCFKNARNNYAVHVFTGLSGLVFIASFICMLHMP